MTDLMQRELTAVLYMVVAGMTVMLLLESGKYILQRTGKYKRLHNTLYLMIWIAAAYLFCQYLYEATYGVIFWYTLPAFAAGCILWKKIFCGILNLYKNAKNYNGDKDNEEKDKGESQGL